MKRAFVLLALLLASAGVIAGQAAASGSGAAGVERLQTLDNEILERLNATRAAHGLRPLVMSGGLQDAAVLHSRAMLEGGFFAHESADGSSFVDRVKRHYGSAGYRSWSAGENLIYDTEELGADVAIKAWLDSPAHRENMLDPGWREVGIGALHASSAGGTFGGEPTWVVTMDFGARSGSAKAAKSKPLELLSVKQPGKRAKPVTHVRAGKTASGAKHAKAAAPSQHRAEKPKPKPKAGPKPKPVKQGRVDRVLPGASAGHDDDQADDDISIENDSAGNDDTADDSDGDPAADDADDGGDDGEPDDSAAPSNRP